MCWQINKIDYEKNPEKYHKIAEEDITVYKFGNEIGNEFSPAYQVDFCYKANVTNKYEELFIDIYKMDCYINKGYHSYSGDCSIIFYNLNKNAITPFFGVYPKNDNTKVENVYIGNILGIFTIPKGIEYYENEHGEIASSQLIWTGKVIDYGKAIEQPTKLKDYVLGNK